MLHEDHLGNRGRLSAGGVQWMTAGRGVIHSEMPQQEEGRMHGFQLWINLPAAEKLKDPAYREIPAATIPVATLPDVGNLSCGHPAGWNKERDNPLQDVSASPSPSPSLWSKRGPEQKITPKKISGTRKYRVWQEKWSSP